MRATGAPVSVLLFAPGVRPTTNLVGILFRYVSQRIIFKIRRDLKKAHSGRGKNEAIRGSPFSYQKPLITAAILIAQY
jgi:hypothetical protein